MGSNGHARDLDGEKERTNEISEIVCVVEKKKKVILFLVQKIEKKRKKRETR